VADQGELRANPAPHSLADLLPAGLPVRPVRCYRVRLADRARRHPPNRHRTPDPTPLRL